jgi:hypothetical protein
VLDAMPLDYDGVWFKIVKFEKPLTVYVDGVTRKGIVKL